MIGTKMISADGVGEEARREWFCGGGRHQRPNFPSLAVAAQCQAQQITSEALTKFHKCLNIWPLNISQNIAQYLVHLQISRVNILDHS